MPRHRIPHPILNPPGLVHQGDPSLALACQQCGAAVERYDAHGGAWCAAHFPGCLRFRVASHHWQKPEAWLADPHAHTIMASPPGWARMHGRNLPLFAPPARLVFGKLDPAEYTRQFCAVMRERLPQVREWIRTHDGQQVTLLCACPGASIDERFCHRYLVAKLLAWLGCVDMPWQRALEGRAR
jgi:hypothetical protein